MAETNAQRLAYSKPNGQGPSSRPESKRSNFTGRPPSAANSGGTPKTSSSRRRLGRNCSRKCALSIGYSRNTTSRPLPREPTIAPKTSRVVFRRRRRRASTTRSDFSPTLRPNRRSPRCRTTTRRSPWMSSGRKSSSGCIAATPSSSSRTVRVEDWISTLPRSVGAGRSFADKVRSPGKSRSRTLIRLPWLAQPDTIAIERELPKSLDPSCGMQRALAWGRRRIHDQETHCLWGNSAGVGMRHGGGAVVRLRELGRRWQHAERPGHLGQLHGWKLLGGNRRHLLAGGRLVHGWLVLRRQHRSGRLVLRWYLHGFRGRRNGSERRRQLRGPRHQSIRPHQARSAL